MKTKLLLVIVFTALFMLIYGCTDYNCDEEMQEAKSRYGPPEEVNTYDSGDYHSVDYWWWSKGVNKGFTWSKDQDCEVSTYTFEPITDLSEENKAKARRDMILIGVERCNKQDITR